MRHRFVIGLLALATFGGDDPADDLPNAKSAQVLGSMEVRVQFDRPLDEKAGQALLAFAQGRTIPYYDFLWNGDEAIPRGGPLGELRIAAARLGADQSSLLLATDPHPRRAVYVIDWNDGKGPRVASYLYSGVETQWFADAETMEPKHTFIHRTFAIEPGQDGPLMAREGNPRRVELRAKIQFLKGKQTLVLDGNMPFEATVAGEDARPEPTGDKRHRVEVPLEAGDEPVEVLAILDTGETGPKSDFSARWKIEGKETPVPQSRIALPGLATERPPGAIPNAPFDLAGGDPVKGEAIFRSETSKCASCHARDGKGGAVGPALENVIGRDPRDVYQSIAEPSVRIAPEYRTYTVSRKDGQVAVGVLRTENFEAVKVLDINGQATVIPRAEIDQMQPSDTSTMPVGLAGAIGEAGMRDLIAYLIQKR